MVSSPWYKMHLQKPLSHRGPQSLSRPMPTASPAGYAFQHGQPLRKYGTLGWVELVFGVAHVVELGFFIGGEIAGVEGGADFFHHGVVEVEVVEDAEAHAQHFLGL